MKFEKQTDIEEIIERYNKRKNQKLSLKSFKKQYSA